MLSLIQKACRECIAFLHDLIDNNTDAGRSGRAAIRNLDEQIRQAEESVTDVDAELRIAQNDALKAGADAARSPGSEGRRPGGYGPGARRSRS